MNPDMANANQPMDLQYTNENMMLWDSLLPTSRFHSLPTPDDSQTPFPTQPGNGYF
jgi:hypothetical protein